MARMRIASLGVGRRSIEAVSFLVLSISFPVPIQFEVPAWNPATGRGYMLISAMPFRLCADLGMMLPGNGVPLASVTMYGLEKKLFGAVRSSLKFPWRIRRLGTVA